MSKYAIIAEGPTDQIVLENILLGYFQNDEEEPTVNFVQPPPPTAVCPAPPAGWSLVFASLRRGDPQKALQFNDYLVIHIDADVQEEPGFDVSRRENNKELSVPDRIDRIIDKLKVQMDSAFYDSNAHRILFAIAVDTIECWLLPLLHEDKKAKKISGCLGAANAALRKANRKGLASGDTKFPHAYEEASREYTKHKTLRKHADRNPSLQVFIKWLDKLFRNATETEP
ncbi:MAG: phage tail protein [Gemmataceae bacterium]